MFLELSGVPDRRLLRGIYRCSVIKTLYLQKKAAFQDFIKKLPYLQVYHTLFEISVAIMVFEHEPWVNETCPTYKGSWNLKETV